jgi:hypothetical protein
LFTRLEFIEFGYYNVRYVIISGVTTFTNQGDFE